MPSWVWTSSSPARRRARLMSTGRSTRGDAVLGERDDGAALALGVVEERGQGGVEVGGGPAASGGSSGPKRWRS